MENRKRSLQLKFRVTPEERETIENKMSQYGTTNMAAYLRKMAIDGYMVKVEIPELKEMVSLLRYSSNNINQIAKKLNSGFTVHNSDFKEVLKYHERMWDVADRIISSLAKLK